ncbi:MAG: glycerophosphodiester phosphodiesterase [Acidimicrobiia bacterium]|nr:MAG: glycerophosphodiester phosphodiesterase [Acidimicrobiia bacterium]
MKPYLAHEHPIRFAHRGSRVLWPENTMPAFQGAVDLGYRYLETDVHLTRDGKVVIFHDHRLERLTDGVGRVWERGWEELRRLDAAHHFATEGEFPYRGKGVGIPLLEEVVRSFPEVMLNLDLKQRGVEQAVATEVLRLGVEDRVLIGSFHDTRIRRFRRITEGRVATSAGPREVSRAVTSAVAGARVRGRADALQVPDRLASKRLIDAAHRGGKQVHVWTVNDPERMRQLLALGVDGIVTDRPDLLNEVLGIG